MISIILPYYNRIDLLRPTMDSFVHFYKDSDVEIVIVDDCSSDNNRVDDFSGKYPLNVKIVRINSKSGINPCYPYNVGVRKSSGNIVVLSSPEIIHTASLFSVSNNFHELDDSTYMQFSVFCLTEKRLRASMIGSLPFVEKLKVFDSKKNELFNNLGAHGYDYNNSYGSWYTHSKIRPSCLNFLSAMTRHTYDTVGGFDERFRFGTGFDDTDFRDRLLNTVKRVVWYDECIAVHIDHEVVNNLPPTTNESVFALSKRVPYQKKDWGLL